MENRYTKIDKNIIANNIKTLVESNFYYDEYCKLINKKFGGLENINNSDDMENISAMVFNTILLVCQLTANLANASKLATEILHNNCFYEEGIINTEIELHDFYADILSKYDPYYQNDALYKINHRIKHGFAIHFTTPKIAEKIKANGSFLSTNKMFSRSLENKIIKINKYFNSIKKYNMLNGFGFSKGISMGAQTIGFYKERTPESLYMLFGGQTCTRNKQKAMSFIENILKEAPEELRQDTYHELERVWDDLIGNIPIQTAILIDRDKLEYSDEYDRPFHNIYLRSCLSNFMSIEHKRYVKDIPHESLYFVNVPMLRLLNQYYIERKHSNLYKINQLEEQNESHKYKTRTLNRNLSNKNGFINILAITTVSLLLLITFILIYNFIKM